MRGLLSAFGGLATRVESWWALVLLLMGTSGYAWLAAQWQALAAQGWAAVMIVAVFFACFTLTAISLAALAWSRRKGAPAPVPAPPNDALIQALMARPQPARRKVKPLFGIPRQEATESYLSWWHIPVSVLGDGGSPNDFIDHCTVEMVSSFGFLGIGVEPLRLRWRSEDDPKGKSEETLVEGVQRLVPLVIRCEPGRDVARHHTPLADGVPRITGARYIRDGDLDERALPTGGGRIEFALRVRSGKKEWTSPYRYSLRLPQEGASNGTFILEIAEPSTANILLALES